MQSMQKPKSIFPTHLEADWIKIEKKYRVPGVKERSNHPEVRVAFTKGFKKKSGSNSTNLTLIINHAMLEKLGWQPKDRIVFYQHPDNACLIMGVKSEDDGFKLYKQSNDRYQLSFLWESIPVDFCPPFKVEYEVTLSEPPRLTFWFKL